MYFLKTVANPRHRRELLARFERIDPSRPPRWGRMSAVRMLAHLCDQMEMTINNEPVDPIPGPQRYPVVRQLILYVVPWPRGKVKGPPAAFRSEPREWAENLERLREQVDRFAGAPADRGWPDHPIFGPMDKRVWGVFTYRHFDHHLRQFGA